MKIITLTDEEYEEICENYKVRQDESYCNHTAYTIWEAIKRENPEDIRDYEEELENTEDK